MFWAEKANKDTVDVRRLMGRILNNSFATSCLAGPEDEARHESRSNIVVPVIVIVIEEDADCEPIIHTAITQDISCEGMAILSQTFTPTGGVIVGFGPLSDWIVLKCTCLRTSSAGYGYFKSGLQIEKVMSPADFEAIRQYLEALEDSATQTLAAAD